MCHARRQFWGVDSLFPPLNFVLFSLFCCSCLGYNFETWVYGPHSVPQAGNRLPLPLQNAKITNEVSITTPSSLWITCNIDVNDLLGYLLLISKFSFFLLCFSLILAPNGFMLCSVSSSTSASRAGVTGMNHHTQPDFFHLFLCTFIHLFGCEGLGASTMACLCRSEDILWKSILSFQLVVPGNPLYPLSNLYHLSNFLLK